MTPAEVGGYALSLALTGVLLWSAVSDIRVRRIPNLAVVAVLALYALWAIAGYADSVPGGLLAGAIALGVCFALYWFGIIGAGDAKLFAAVALFAGLAHLSALALATVLAGGAIVVVGLVLDPRKAFLLWAMRGKADTGRGVPYGVAIALGALVVQWGPPLPILGLPSPGA